MLKYLAGIIIVVGHQQCVYEAFYVLIASTYVFGKQ